MKDISAYLNTGEAEAITGRELCHMLRMTPRELTQAIERARRQGVPICATCNGSRPGYYLAASRRDMERYCRSLWKRAGEIFKTRRACLRTMEQLPEQEEMKA